MGKMATRRGTGIFDRFIKHEATSWRNKCYEIVFTNVSFPGRDEGSQMVFTTPSEPYRLKRGTRYSIEIHYNPDAAPSEYMWRDYPIYLDAIEVPTKVV